MDLVVRSLREGQVQGLACLAVIEDALTSVGGPALFRKIVQDLIASLAQGRAQATSLTIAAISGSPALYQSLVRGGVQVDIVDLQKAMCYLTTAPGGLVKGSDVVNHLTACIPLGAPQHSRCIIIDDLSALADSAGAASVADMLYTLRRRQDVSSLLCCLHTDLHSPEEAAMMRHQATCVVSLHPPGMHGALLPNAVEWGPHGKVQTLVKRKNGRAVSESKLYRVTGRGITFRDIGGGTPSGPTAPNHSSAAPDTRAAATLAQQVAGGMNLGLTEEEKAARGSVQLPYEHQGQSARYATGSFRDYLPAAAGGHGAGAGAGKLGHILYVRDSDSEDGGDSDEDPDDDLDI